MNGNSRDTDQRMTRHAAACAASDQDRKAEAMEAQAQAQGWTADTVEAAEHARCAAMIAGDTAALHALFADNGTWTHSSAQVDTAGAFIARIASGASRYLRIERSETGVRIYGDAAIASGIATMSALADGEPKALRNRYTNVWTLDDGRPRLVSAQSTKLA